MNKIDVNKYRKIYDRDSIVVIQNFISPDLLDSITGGLINYKWWSYAILPYKNEWKPKHFDLHDRKFKDCFNPLDILNFLIFI